MARRRQVYEGKAKVLFEGPEPGTLVQYFKDDASAFNNKKQGIITGKGVLNNRISEYLMTRLGEVGVPTHFVRRLNMREQLVREVEIIPITIVVRNICAGSLCTRFGMSEGTPLPRSIVEYYYKSDELEDPMVTEEHITAFGWATPQDLDEIMSISLRVNDFLSGLFLGVGIRLVDFKLEYGRLWEDEQMRIMLADEDQPRQLPSVGHQDQREDGQGPLPQGPGRGRGSIPGGRSPPWHPARRRSPRPQRPGRDAMRGRA